MSTEDDRDLARVLIAQGYKSTSNKSRHVARLPEGETGLQALQRCAPSEFLEIMRLAEQRAANMYLRMGYAASEGNQQTLSDDVFRAFRTLGGEASW